MKQLTSFSDQCK